MICKEHKYKVSKTTPEEQKDGWFKAITCKKCKYRQLLGNKLSKEDIRRAKEFLEEILK